MRDYKPKRLCLSFRVLPWLKHDKRRLPPQSQRATTESVVRRRHLLLLRPDIRRRDILQLLVQRLLGIPQLPNIHFLPGHLLTQGINHVILERKSHFQFRNSVFEGVFAHEVWSALSVIWYHAAFYRHSRVSGQAALIGRTCHVT